MAHNGTGHIPTTNSTATFPLSLFLIHIPIATHLSRHYPDNYTLLQPDHGVREKYQMHFEIPQTVFVPSGERNPLATLGLAFSQPLIQLMA